MPEYMVGEDKSQAAEASERYQEEMSRRQSFEQSMAAASSDLAMSVVPEICGPLTQGAFGPSQSTVNKL